MTIDGFFSMIYKQYMEIFPSILTDKLTVSYAPGQLIGGGCFAAAVGLLITKYSRLK